MTVIIPGDDRGQMARDLLSLTDNPFDVQTDSDGHFIVPEWLAEAYEVLAGDIDSVPEDEPAAVNPAGPKRRGRARKET